MGVWVEPAGNPVNATIVAPTPALSPGAAATGIKLLVAVFEAVTSQVIDRGSYRGPAALVVVNIGTGSPTETFDIQGSVDGKNFYNIGYSLVATPVTVVVTQITITASATTTYLLAADQAWRYLRVVVGPVTTNTTWVTYYQ